MGINYIDINNTTIDLNNKKRFVVSLFTGAGGLDIGLEMAGFTTVMCIENDSNCRATLKHNRPEWCMFEKGDKEVNGITIRREIGDIRNIDVSEVKMILKKGGKSNIDLVVGGAPCQPFSNIGKKQGKDDKKNGDLFLEFVKFVKGLNPKAFIFENVSGITQKKHEAIINYMVEKLGGLGYGISRTVLNAANYGVPQRRERFFLIGIKGVDTPAFPLPTHFKQDKKTFEDFKNEFDTLPDLFNPKKWKTVNEAFKSLPKSYRERNDYKVMRISNTVQERMKYIKQGQNFKVIPKNMRPKRFLNGKHQGNDTFGRLRSNQPSLTIRTAAYNPSKGMYIHPIEDRGLDIIEMAALQSFPYNWEFKCANNSKITLISGGKQIGNAVPPKLAEAVGRAMMIQINSL